MKAGWQINKLASLCDVFTDGDWIESKDQSAEGIRLIQTGNVGLGEFKDRVEKARYISEDTFKRLRCTEIYEGDCLISRLPDPAGRACIIPEIGEKLITAVDCTIVRFRSDKVFPTFFNYYAQSHEYLNNVASQSTGATRLRISRANLGEIQIPIPPLPEQQRIVAILDEAFEGIATATANAKKNLANARELFESYLQSVFTHKADDWEKKSIGSVIKLEYGKPLDQAHRKNNGQYPVYGANGEKSRTSKFYYDKTSIIVGRKGSAGEINLSEEKFWPLDVTYFVTYDDKENDLMFLYYLLGSLKLPLLAKGVKPGINRNEVYALTAYFPDLKTQNTTVTKLNELSIETKKLEAIYQQKLTALDELKKSILNQAFSGQLN